MVQVLSILCSAVFLIWFTRLVVVSGVLVWRRRQVARRLAPARTDAMVSLLIPARNEASNIGRCLERVLQQDYPRLEIIVIDDRSTDSTASIVEQMAQADSRVRLVRITELTPGWTGKNHALARGAEQARGDYLIFTDADTVLSTDNVSRVVAETEHKGLDMLSLLTAQETGSFWEHTLQPAFSGMLMAQFPLTMVNSPKSKLAFANGQYILFRREAYQALGGHEAVKNSLLEDIALARLAKQHGLKVEVMLGQHLIRVRMYENLKQIWSGWGRIFYAGLQASIPKLVWGVVMLLVFSLMPGCIAVTLLIRWGLYGASAVPMTLLAISLITLAAQFSSLAVFYTLLGCRVRYVALYHLASVMGIAVLCSALKKCFGRSTITWKGTTYNCAGS